jgi:hypothetical protein
VPCPTIRNCDVSTTHNRGGILVSVGVRKHGAQRFVVCCIKDPVLGCAHLPTDRPHLLLLFEMALMALRNAD